MISYDFNSHSLNGEAVPYCALPFHAIEAAFSHKQLTQTAKNAYIALLSYAAYKNKLSFGITVTWIADKLAVTRKTAGAALAQLREFGFANEQGINIPTTEKRAKTSVKKEPAKTQSPSYNKEPSKLVPVVVSTDSGIENKKQPEEPEHTLSFEEQVETFVKTGFSREKAEKMALMAINAVKKQEENFTQPVDTFYTYNNTQIGSTQDNLPVEHENLESESQFAGAKNNHGKFYSAGANGSCQESKKRKRHTKNFNLRLSILEAFGDKDIRYPEKFIPAALFRMKVRVKSEIERYFAEIMFSIKNNQMKSIRGCLWLIEQGKWKAPAGMY